MNWENAELSDIIKIGAIGVLLWSFISLFRLFPINYDIIIPIATITLVYWVVEVAILFRFDHYLITLPALFVYAIFSGLFFFTGQTSYLYVSYVSFGIIFPRICRVRGEPQENKEQAGFQAAGFALGFGLSLIGITSGVMISNLYSFLILLVGVFLGGFFIIGRRKGVEKEIRSEAGIIKKGLVYLLGCVAIGEVIFLGITVYTNPALLCYYTGLDYEYTLILVMISFALAGILCIFFNKLIAHFENRIYLIFILLNVLGLVGFLLMLVVQSILLIILLFLANISLFFGLSIAFHLLSKLNLNWSFIPIFTLSFGLYALILFSGITYFYALGLLTQLVPILLIKKLIKEEGENV